MSEWRKRLESSNDYTTLLDNPKVYFIQSINGGLIKIGYSSHINRRLREIQRTSPVKLRVLATISGRADIETEIHHKFRDERKHGEWFNPSQELLQYIINILLGDSK